jgi:hypothetical protein
MKNVFTIKLKIIPHLTPTFIDISNFLLIEHEVCTGKYRTQKDRGWIFLCTYRASEVNKKFIIWHLYLKQTKNA